LGNAATKSWWKIPTLGFHNLANFLVIASAAKQSSPEPGPGGGLDCVIAAAKRQFILSEAAGGVEGLLAMTGDARRR
jgi:hypothetical protein